MSFITSLITQEWLQVKGKLAYSVYGAQARTI